MGDQNDVIREQVESKLAALKIQDLDGVCTEIDLPVDDAVKGNRNKLYRHLLSHLWAEGDKEDEGFPTYKVVHDYLVDLEQKQDDIVDVKPERKPVVDVVAALQ